MKFESEKARLEKAGAVASLPMQGANKSPTFNLVKEKKSILKAMYDSFFESHI